MRPSYKAIYDSFFCLRNKLGKRAINETSTLCLGTINIGEHVFYFLLNGTKNKTFEVVFEDCSKVTMKKVLITKVKPKAAYELNINATKENNKTFYTLEDSSTEQEIVKSKITFGELDQDALDEFYKNSDYVDYNFYNPDFLFEIEIPEVILEIITFTQINLNTVKVRSPSGQEWVLVSSFLKDKTIYTNDWSRVSSLLDKMEIDIPTKERSRLLQNKEEMKEDLKHLIYRIHNTSLEKLPEYSLFQKHFYKLMELF